MLGCQSWWTRHLFPFWHPLSNSDLHWFFSLGWGLRRLLKIIGFIGPFLMAFRLGNSIRLYPVTASKGGSIDTKIWRKKSWATLRLKILHAENPGFSKRADTYIYIHSMRNWVKFLSLLEMSLLRIEGYHWWDCPSVSEMVILAALFFNGQKTTAEKTSENWMPWQHDSIPWTE